MRFLRYCKDIRIIAPILFLVGFELFLQSGIYGRYMLKRNSYADNIRRVERIVSKNEVGANTIILGTSVPYQGILMDELNKGLEGTGMVVQNASCQGAMIDAQYVLYRELNSSMDIDTVILFTDVALAWKTRYAQGPANQSMTAQFSRHETIPLLLEMGYEFTVEDYAYYLLRSVTFKSDLRSFALRPDKRIKDIGRKLAAEEGLLYPYENQEQFALSIFDASSLTQCRDRAGYPPGWFASINATQEGDTFYNEAGQPISNNHHAEAVFLTCRMGVWENEDKGIETGNPQWQKLYFSRLKMLVEEIYANGQKVVLVFPPYSQLVSNLNDDTRLAIWDRNLADIFEGKSYYVIDTQEALDGPDNADYYYDVLHLNRIGAEAYTDHLTPRLRDVALEIQRD